MFKNKIERAISRIIKNRAKNAQIKYDAECRSAQKGHETLVKSIIKDANSSIVTAKNNLKSRKEEILNNCLKDVLKI